MDIVKKLNLHKQLILDKVLNDIPSLLEEKEEYYLDPKNLNNFTQKIRVHSRTDVNDIIRSYTDEELRMFLNKVPEMHIKRRELVKEMKKTREVKDFKRELERNIRKEDVLKVIKERIEQKRIQKLIKENTEGTKEWFFVYFKENAYKYEEVIKEALIKNIVRVFLNVNTKEGKMLNYKEFGKVNDFFTTTTFTSPSIPTRRDRLFKEVMKVVAREGVKDLIKEVGKEKLDRYKGRKETHLGFIQPFVYQIAITTIYKRIVNETKKESFENIFLTGIESDKRLKKRWHKKRLRNLF